MQYRKLGTSSLEISEVGLGTWAIGGWWWGGTDDEKAIQTIRRAIDLGVTFIDTAPMYGYGHSEEIVGKAIEGRRDKIVLATKCGLNWWSEEGEYFFTSERGKVFRCLKKHSILKEVDDSLQRLKTEYIDLYQCHWPDKTTPLAETMEAMMTLLDQGKIRAIGVSNFTVEMMEECLKHGVIHSLQPRYNMLDRTIEKELLPFCREHNIGVVVYSPLEQGVLTGKVTLDRKFPPGDMRPSQPWFQKHNLKRALEFLDKIKVIADAHEVTLAQLAINWVLCQPGVTCAIVGARRPEQAEDNVKGSGWALTEEELKRIREWLEELGEPE